MNAIYVGIDVAKAKLDAAVWLNERSQSLGVFSNDPTGFEQLTRRLRQVAPTSQPYHFIVEPTGGYELALAAFAYAQDWLVSLPNPKQVRDWAKGQGRRAKNDQLDAAVLTEYGARQHPKPQPAVPVVVQQLESLLARQQDLQHMLRQERNRQQALAHRPVVAQQTLLSIERLIATLQCELEQLEQALDTLIRSEPTLQAKLPLLRSVPGVGPKNAPHLLVLLFRWNLLTAGQGSAKGLTAHVGLDPSPFESGSSVFKRAAISKMGNPHLRSLLYMGALGGVRGQNPLRAFYERLVARGKAKKLALVAAARKLLTWAWAVFRTDTPFDTKIFQP